MQVPSWLRAALITAGQSFAGVVLLQVVALFAQFPGWLDGGPTPDFASAGQTVLAAAVAAATSIVTAVHRRISPPEATYPQGG